MGCGFHGCAFHGGAGIFVMAEASLIFQLINSIKALPLTLLLNYSNLKLIRYTLEGFYE